MQTSHHVRHRLQQLAPSRRGPISCIDLVERLVTRQFHCHEHSPHRIHFVSFAEQHGLRRTYAMSLQVAEDAEFTREGGFAGIGMAPATPCMVLLAFEIDGNLSACRRSKDQTADPAPATAVIVGRLYPLRIMIPSLLEIGELVEFQQRLP